MKVFIAMGQKKSWKNSFVYILFFVIPNAFAANILGIAPFASHSHFNVLRPVFHELAKRGHNITIISALKDDVNLPNYRHIQVDKKTPAQIFSESNNSTISPSISTIYAILPEMIRTVFVWGLLSKINDFTLKSKQVQEFIKNDNSHFDLVICEELNFMPYYMFAYKYKAPLVTIMTLTGAHYVNDFMGNPMNIHYVPHEFYTPYEGNSVWNRIMNIFVTYFHQLVRYNFFIPMYNKIAREHFGHLPQPLPDVQDLERNISVVFTNTHFSIDVVRSYLPSIVEIGGIHMKEIKPLPEDLKAILDNSKQGVIYFSLGSTIPSSSLSEEQQAVFLKVFSQLEQTVLWKWDNLTLPGKPYNVVIRKWLPQSDILGHPNVRLFITHGGLLSNIETIYRGVPIVGIPFGGDQPANIARAKAMGYGELVNLETISTATLGSAIDKVLHDSKYRNKARELSKLINDKPLSALESAMFWIEYVIRHKGAYHLKTPSSWMPWYEYYLLDVIAIISVVTLVFIVVQIYVIKLFFNFSIIKSSTKKVIRKDKTN